MTKPDRYFINFSLPASQQCALCSAGKQEMIPWFLLLFMFFLTRLISPLSHSFTRLDSSQPFSLSKMADRKTRGIFVLRLPNTQLNTSSLWFNSLFMIIYCFYCLFLFFFSLRLTKKSLKVLEFLLWRKG